MRTLTKYTKSGIASIPNFNSSGFEGAQKSEKVISLKADFCNVRSLEFIGIF